MTEPRATLAPQGIGRRVFLRRCSGTAALLFLYGCAPQKLPRAPAEGATSAERAVRAARRFAGTSLTVGWESGLQTHGLMQFAAPRWEELTGISINLVGMGSPLDQFRRITAEHRARTGALDCAAIVPTWMPDLLADGALEPLDDYVAHYMIPADLDDYLPLYRNLGRSDGERYGFFDDGDVLLLFYRRDLFEDASYQKEFAAKHGRPLGDPRHYDWRQFIDAARFFTETYAPDLYGLSPLPREILWAYFEYRLRVEGGQFFDPKSMKPGVDSPSAQRAMEQLMETVAVMVPTGFAELTSGATLASFLSGKTAMAIGWPATGRWGEQEAPRAKPFSFVPKSQIAGKAGYALLPDGVSELAVGFILSVLARSQRKEAAYLFIQWLVSPEISLERVGRKDTGRDPYRYSHIHASEMRTLWPNAGEYLDTLEKAGGGDALLELMIPGTYEYQESFYAALTNVRLGTPIKEALQELAQAWDEITERRGRSRQRHAYADFLKQSGAVMPAPR